MNKTEFGELIDNDPATAISLFMCICLSEIDSNSTNSTGSMFEIPCDVVCVSASAGSLALIVIVTVIILLLVCCYLVKRKRGMDILLYYNLYVLKGLCLAARMGETDSEVHSYTEVDENMGTDDRCKDYTLTYFGPTDQNTTNITSDPTPDENVTTTTSGSHHYGTVLGTIDNDYDDYDDVEIAHKSGGVQSSVTVHVGSGRGWEQEKR